MQNRYHLLIIIQLFTFSFRMMAKKLDSTKEFAVDLSIQLNVEDRTTNFTILSDTRIPFKQCESDHYVLPGDGSVSGFVSAVGATVGEAAVEAVLNHLGIGQYVSDSECSIPENEQQSSGMTTHHSFY